MLAAEVVARFRADVAGFVGPVSAARAKAQSLAAQTDVLAGSISALEGVAAGSTGAIDAEAGAVGADAGAAGSAATSNDALIAALRGVVGESGATVAGMDAVAISTGSAGTTADAAAGSLVGLAAASQASAGSAIAQAGAMDLDASVAERQLVATEALVGAVTGLDASLVALVGTVAAAMTAEMGLAGSAGTATVATDAQAVATKGLADSLAMAGGAMGAVGAESGVMFGGLAKGFAGVKSLSTEAGSGFLGMSGAASAGFAIAGVAVAAFAYKAIKAYSAHQVVLKQLENSIAHLPNLAGASAAAFETQSVALSHLTGMDHEQIISADVMLGRFKMTQAQILTLTPAIIDFARATGQDATTAAQGVGKALLGSTRALKMVGIEFKATGNTAVDFDNILAALRSHVGGAAAAFATTLPGKIAIFKNELHLTAETAGKQMIPAVTGLLSAAMPLIPMFADFARVAVLAVTVLAKLAPYLLALGVAVGVAKGVGLLAVAFDAAAAAAGRMNLEGLVAFFGKGAAAIRGLTGGLVAETAATDASAVAMDADTVAVEANTVAKAADAEASGAMSGALGALLSPVGLITLAVVGMGMAWMQARNDAKQWTAFSHSLTDSLLAGVSATRLYAQAQRDLRKAQVPDWAKQIFQTKLQVAFNQAQIRAANVERGRINSILGVTRATGAMSSITRQAVGNLDFLHGRLADDSHSAAAFAASLVHATGATYAQKVQLASLVAGFDKESGALSGSKRGLIDQYVATNNVAAALNIAVAAQNQWEAALAAGKAAIEQQSPALAAQVAAVHSFTTATGQDFHTFAAAAVDAYQRQAAAAQTSKPKASDVAAYDTFVAGALDAWKKLRDGLAVTLNFVQSNFDSMVSSAQSGAAAMQAAISGIKVDKSFGLSAITAALDAQRKAAGAFNADWEAVAKRAGANAGMVLSAFSGMSDGGAAAMHSLAGASAGDFTKVIDDMKATSAQSGITASQIVANMMSQLTAMGSFQTNFDKLTQEGGASAHAFLLHLASMGSSGIDAVNAFAAGNKTAFQSAAGIWNDSSGKAKSMAGDIATHLVGAINGLRSAIDALVRVEQGLPPIEPKVNMGPAKAIIDAFTRALESGTVTVNVAAKFAAGRMAAGGMVGGGAGGGDRVLKMLEPGEHVMPTHQVRKYGTRVFEALRRGTPDPVAVRGAVGAMADGGIVEGSVPADAGAEDVEPMAAGGAVRRRAARLREMADGGQVEDAGASVGAEPAVPAAEAVGAMASGGVVELGAVGGSGAVAESVVPDEAMAAGGMAGKHGRSQSLASLPRSPRVPGAVAEGTVGAKAAGRGAGIGPVERMAAGGIVDSGPGFAIRPGALTQSTVVPRADLTAIHLDVPTAYSIDTTSFQTALDQAHAAYAAYLAAQAAKSFGGGTGGGGVVGGWGVALSPRANAYKAEMAAHFPAAQYGGGYNRRYIAGTTIWSQHAYGNAIDEGTGGNMITGAGGNAALGDAMAAYARANAQRLAIAHLLWRVPDHYGHTHADFYPQGTGTPGVHAPPAGGGAPVPNASHAQNVAIVHSLASARGWGSGSQWADLVELLNRESGFDNLAQNPNSSAYGMFQFLDATWGHPYPKTSDPYRQTVDGMVYIAGRYGSPSGAEQHSDVTGWYDRGGMATRRHLGSFAPGEVALPLKHPDTIGALAGAMKAAAATLSPPAPATVAVEAMTRAFRHPATVSALSAPLLAQVRATRALAASMQAPHAPVSVHTAPAGGYSVPPVSAAQGGSHAQGGASPGGGAGRVEVLDFHITDWERGMGTIRARIIGEIDAASSYASDRGRLNRSG